MSTRAELVSIHALSAELFASATCCSSLARRAFVSAGFVVGAAAGAAGIGAVCASRGRDKGKTSNTTTLSLGIGRFPLKITFPPASEVALDTIWLLLTLSFAGAPRKSKLFIVPIRICYCRRARNHSYSKPLTLPSQNPPPQIAARRARPLPRRSSPCLRPAYLRGVSQISETPLEH